MMVEEPFAQRVERLVQERNVPALLAEAQQLLTIYLDGDDNLDVEPIVSALSILQRVAAMTPIVHRIEQFTSDEVAQIVAGAVNTVMEALAVGHTVDGVAVLPGGESTFLVDVVMRDGGTGNTWGVLVTFPPENGPIVKSAQYPGAQIE